VKRLSKARFNALCYSRQPPVAFMAREVEWWSDLDEHVLGTVLLDTTDQDWSWVALGRDEKALFRAIDLEVSIKTQRKASARLRDRLREYAQSGETEFPQHDTDNKKNEILAPIVPDERLHPNFKILKTGEAHSPARAIIREIAYAFVDVDGNYVKDFQTTGFNSRLWELFLFAFLYEQKFYVDRDVDRPDFCAVKFGFPVAIEAVTVNPTTGEKPPVPDTPEEAHELRQNYMPIKFGSALYSKLAKRYWELAHVKDIPLIIAIHDFHAGDSMIWSAPAIEDYLYGVRASWTKDEVGTLHITETPIAEHEWKGKKIPSGFFNLPDAEHVSAVLFSNSATLSKFGRMAKLAEFGNPDVIMFRAGTRHNFDPNATEPLEFKVEVTPNKYSENWSQGVHIYHNPHALIPIPDDLFEDCSQHFFRNGRRVAILTETHIYASRTFIFGPDDSSAAANFRDKHTTE
jgi:hypothetical protein